MLRQSCRVALIIVAGDSLALAQAPERQADGKPPHERLLTGQDALAASDRLERAMAAEEADRYEEAISLHEELLALRTHGQGADHWQAVSQKWELERVRKLAASSPEDRATWRSLNGEGARLHQSTASGQPTADLTPLRKAMELNRRLFGQEHPDTALSYTRMGAALYALGRYRESEVLLVKALAINRRLLGEEHPETVGVCDNLAACLDDQGRHVEAQRLLEQMLAVQIRLYGEEHTSIANTCNSLGANLQSQGKLPEAQALLQKALDLRLRLLGADDPGTAVSYNNLASNLEAQGKFAAAQPLYQRALEMFRQLVGEDHSQTAIAYSNLAGNLNAQGKYVEAQSLYERALELLLKLYGESHPYIATCYGALAGNLTDQKKHADAQPLLQKALDLNLRLLGPKHPMTALAYGNLAANLDAQNKFDEAEGLHRKALVLFKNLFGERHPRTANCIDNLATCLMHQGEHATAQPLIEQALELHRELVGEHHPTTITSCLNLADNLRNQFKFAEARELLARTAERYEATRLNVAARGLDRSVFGVEWSPYRLLAATEALLSHPEAAWLAAEHDLARGAGDDNAARRGAPLSEEEQQRQSELAARLAQLAPRIEQLSSGQSAADADERDELQRLLGERGALEVELARLAATISQREVAGLVDVQSAIPDDAALVLWIEGAVGETWGCVVRSTGAPAWRIMPANLVPQGAALGAAATFPKRLASALSEATPQSEIAELAEQLDARRLAPLEGYLDGVKRLYVVPVGEMAGVPVELLTDRYEASYVPSGTFLARLKDRPAPQGMSLLAVGDPVSPGEWAELPGTAVEVARLSALVAQDQATVLTRADASESALDRLRTNGKLQDFRYLHFATHGEPNNVRAFESALILSQDQVPQEVPVGDGGHLDGRLTASEVLEDWELDADLVTLSACESALGRPGGGDGILGFAQAFLLAGARSVCLSLWKVDDTATALLMDRFYQNVLGKRDGLDGPLPKATALAEAKQWLRDLTAEEATLRAANLSQGVARGRNEPALPLVVPPTAAAEPAAARPFAHPRYWAAFVLIGDPG